MRYMLLIYDQEGGPGPKPGTPEHEKMMAGYWDFHEEVQRDGVFVAGDPLHGIDTASTVRVRDGETVVSDGPLRRDEGAARGLLHPRVRGPRRGARVRREDPDGGMGIDRGPADPRHDPRRRPELTRLARGSRRADDGRTRLPGRDRPRRRGAHARDRGLRARGGRRAGRTRRGPCPLALRRRPGQPRRVAHDDGATARDRSSAPGSVTAARLRTSCARAARGDRAPDAHTLPDDRLALVFTCCHPALGPEARVALTLRSLCGLTTAEIAKAFLVSEATLAQRVVRAKPKIHEAAISLRVPDPDHLEERLAGVLAVVYLVFNEGYAATEGEDLVRHALCAEAIHLGRMLAHLLPDDPEVLGLLALMLLHDSRRSARTSADGELVTLEDQDRDAWDRDQIAEGIDVLERALRGVRSGPYQVQAAIAALHAQASTPSDTDWPQIVALYRRLLAHTPSPVVELNLAAAIGMAHGPVAGLALIDDLDVRGDLDGYYLLEAARADLLRRDGRAEAAAVAYRRALEITRNSAERRYLERRLASLDDPYATPPGGRTSSGSARRSPRDR